MHFGNNNDKLCMSTDAIVFSYFIFVSVTPIIHVTKFRSTTVEYGYYVLYIHSMYTNFVKWSGRILPTKQLIFSRAHSFILLILQFLLLLFFVQVYRNGVLINTLRPPFAPGRYTVSGLDPETSYRFGATVSNAFGRSRSPLYGSAVTTVGMSLCGTRLMC